MALKDSGQTVAPPAKDLAERTARFAEAVVRFAKKIPSNPVNNRLIRSNCWRGNQHRGQLLRGGQLRIRKGL